jgi:hypothetical protein
MIGHTDSIAMEYTTLKSIYDGFIDARSKYLSRRWHKPKSMVKRIFGSNNEFKTLLGLEGEFQAIAYEWINEHIKLNNLNFEQVEKITLSAEMYKCELVGRSSFLVVISILLATSITFFDQLSILLGENGDIFTLLFGFYSVLLIIIERSNVLRHQYLAEQFIALLKYWINKNKC